MKRKINPLSQKLMSPKYRIRATVATKDFLPENLVMVDCEMTCVQPKRDELLQVAAIKLKRQGNQYVEVGEPLELFLKSDAKPSNDFHRKYLSHIFEKCNESDLDPGMAREKINAWLGDLRGKVMPCGDCVPTDMSFLYENGLIDPPDIGDEGQIEGSFHYEYWEMNPIKAIARHREGRKESLSDLDKENIHDALVDCRNQLVEMNHYLKVLLGDSAKATVQAGLNVPHHTILFDLNDCCQDDSFKKTQTSIPDAHVYAAHPYQTDFPDGREQVPHTTVLFGLENENDLFPLRSYFKEQEPFKFRIGPIKAFRNADKPYDVLVAEIQSEDLERHHWHIRDNFRTKTSFPDYKPHLTLAYIQKNTCQDLEGSHDWQGQEYRCPVVKFSHRDDFRVDLPLKQNEAKQKFVGQGATVAQIRLNSEDSKKILEGRHRGISMGYTVIADNESVLPKELAPATKPEPLPNGIDPREIQRKYKTKILRAASFQDFQELMNLIMVENAIVEEYRVSLAGALNQLRAREGHPVF